MTHGNHPPPVLKLTNRYLSPWSLETMEEVHGFSKKWKDEANLTLTALPYDGLLRANPGFASKVMDVAKEAFGDIPFTPPSILPFRMAHLHRDNDWKDELFLSVAVTSGTPYLLNAITSEGGHYDDGKPYSIRIETGTIFALDPYSWHACLPITGNEGLCSLVQVTVTKEWAQDNRYLLRNA